MPASQIGILRETPLTIAFPWEIPGGIRPSPRKSECFFFKPCETNIQHLDDHSCSENV